MEIRPFLGADADPSELRQRYELYAADRRSVFPGFPIHSYGQYVASARRLTPVAGPALGWSAWERERLIGSASLSVVEHEGMVVAVPRVEVAADSRRRGVGTALLRRLVASASAHGCATLAADAVRVGSDGGLWAERVGFRTVQVFSWQMLHIQEVDPARWQVPVPAGYRLEYWIAAAPEALVAAFASARNAIADSPLGDSSLTHPAWTVERVRRVEAEIAAGGDQSHCVVAIHEDSGVLAAFTELLVDPLRPALCWQRDTAVVRAHRGRGLGRAVKAEMLNRLAAEVPDLDCIVTSTASENAGMRRVNEQVGYVPYAEIGMLEAATADIEAALAIPGPRHRPLLERVADFEA
ncbi:GNAT family N-acetyltransferase [Actinospica durhamensis]|uniref:GNAT family N-acetyltransferase n=1 Tax=Actinospica durhamensis TaxID=1508375 RepID=A0A941F067_9ACTN|nr:GNAT family N-acetyltransferase [Actinospica durhamensis]MBR7838839.1 GNAT family N-acetyltransferase [Actinospica durhamensis]